jgi:hypothetical protein
MLSRDRDGVIGQLTVEDWRSHPIHRRAACQTLIEEAA